MSPVRQIEDLRLDARQDVAAAVRLADTLVTRTKVCGSTSIRRVA